MIDMRERNSFFGENFHCQIIAGFFVKQNSDKNFFISDDLIFRKVRNTRRVLRNQFDYLITTLNALTD